MKEEENVCKISMPLISDDEMKQIDNNLDDIVNQATKQFIHDKELAMLQYIIQKQQEEIEEARNTKSLHYENKELRKQLKEKDKIIDLMAETILEDTIKLDTYWCNGCSKTAECPYEYPKECIIKYFEKQAKEV